MQVINGIIGAINSKTSRNGNSYLEVVVYSLDHQTEDGKNKPVYVRVYEPFKSEFERRLKTKDRVQLPVDKIRENLSLNQEGKPVSYLNANFVMFSYLYSGGTNNSNSNAGGGNSNSNANTNGGSYNNGNSYQNRNNGGGNNNNQQRNYQNQNNNYQNQNNGHQNQNNNTYQNRQNQNQNQNQQAQGNNYGGSTPNQNQNQNNAAGRGPQDQMDDIEAFLGSI